ncbi:hypothetical protein CK203_054998 [Vitis vinifera]|uniref:Uncharacterized protein n=1 Tax=Vitis vinifera TaxID=29760 RepID=A0A438GNF3_VITVI|nr:hypothetical protein CK203_054998 [Vitis vinifera]
MVIASSHSLSRSSQKMRKSTSLSHKKPDQRREELQENRKKLLRAHAIPSSSEPSQAPPFVDQPMPHQEPPTGEAAEPSFPQHHSTSLRRCLGIKIHSQKSGVKSEELVVERSLKLDALNLNWLGVIDGPPLHGQVRKEYL